MGARRCGPRRTDLESRPCRRAGCQAKPGEPCVTFRGDIASWPHAERWNDARAAEGRPFYPRQEGHWVSGTGPFPKRKPHPERPAGDYDHRPVAALLKLPEVRQLIRELEYARWTGRPGYPVRAMVGAVLVKEGYGLGWARTARLIAGHAGLRKAIGGAPSHWACYRFARKLSEHQDTAAVLSAAITGWRPEGQAANCQP
jgi:hypothetical protein